VEISKEFWPEDQTLISPLRGGGRLTLDNQWNNGMVASGSKSLRIGEKKGKAEVVDTTTNAKLKVWFFWHFKGNYWIIDLNPDYQWAVVGEPSRKYLWILSRTPTMDEAVYQGILGRLPLKGYDPDKLRRTDQAAAAK
jgi:lipocalin